MMTGTSTTTGATNTTEVTDEERRRYGDLTISSLYFRWFSNLDVLNEAGDGTGRVESFKSFVGRCQMLTNVSIKLEPFFYDHAVIFAIFVQLQRAFVLIQQLVQGNSKPSRDFGRRSGTRLFRTICVPTAPCSMSGCTRSRR
jgi:hypothetical protein